jgi:TctA family transporter
MKIFMFFVNTMYWLQLFIVPVIVFSFVAFWIYGKDHSNKVYALLLVLAGILLGIFIAEKVRRKYGLSNFFGRMASTSDADTENDHQ